MNDTRNFRRNKTYVKHRFGRLPLLNDTRNFRRNKTYVNHRSGRLPLLNDTRNFRRNKTYVKHPFGHPDAAEDNMVSHFLETGYKGVKVKADP